MWKVSVASTSFDTTTILPNKYVYAGDILHVKILHINERMWRAVLTMYLIRGVGEVQHTIFLQSSSCYCRIYQRVVKVQLIHGQGQSPVTAADHHAAPAVIVVLVPHVDDNAAVRHLKRLRGQKREERV